MAARFSTGMRNKINSYKAAGIFIKVAATTISFETATGPNGGDQIKDSANGLLTAIVRGNVTVYGATTGGNNSTFEVISKASNGSSIEVPVGSLTAGAAGPAVSLVTATGGSFSDCLRNGVIRVFPGVQPASADSEEGTTHLVELSINSLPFSMGGTNGINLNGSTTGTMIKEPSEVWSGIASMTGTAGWARWYDNTRTTGASTTAVRFDGAVATSGSQFNMSNPNIVTGVPVTWSGMTVNLPAF